MVKLQSKVKTSVLGLEVDMHCFPPATQQQEQRPPPKEKKLSEGVEV